MLLSITITQYYNYLVLLSCNLSPSVLSPFAVKRATAPQSASIVSGGGGGGAETLQSIMKQGRAPKMQTRGGVSALIGTGLVLPRPLSILATKI